VLATGLMSRRRDTWYAGRYARHSSGRIDTHTASWGIRSTSSQFPRAHDIYVAKSVGTATGEPRRQIDHQTAIAHHTALHPSYDEMSQKLGVQIRS
jgi:hypothetical protein